MNESGYFSTASGSFHTTSRPPSRAWSESTERPDSSHSNAFAGNGSRSISHEIEHIKKLITRAESNRQHAGGSITAVVFRNRNKEPVAREHIFHELDALKRRIKLEQLQAAERAKEQAHVLARRASQIDPGQESESEVESVLDERDEELERAQEALRVQRERFESLLESAEERVDLLTGRNEGLLLEQKHLEAELKQEKERSHNVLHSAEERLDRLTEEKEIAKARTNHLVEERDLLKRELENLAAETGKLEAHVVREKERLKGELGDTKAQLTRATKEKSALENELQATRKWVEELNAKIEDGAKALQVKSKAFDDLRVEKVSTDVAHRSAQEEILRLHALKTAAETALKESNAKVTTLEQERQEAADQRELSKAEQEQRIKTHERTIRELHSKHETATKHAVELSRKHEESEKALSELKSTHADELERIQAEEATRVKEIDGQHSYEKAELQAAHVDELARVKDASAVKLTDLEQFRAEEVEKLKSTHFVAIGDLQRLHDTALSELKVGHSSELESVKNEAREAARVEAERHANERETHQDQIKAKSDELDTLKLQLAARGERASFLESELSELRNSADASASQLERKVAELSRDLTANKTSLQDAQQAHISALSEVRRAHEREIEGLVKAHAEQKSSSEQSHQDALRKIEDKAASEIVKLQADHAAEVQLLQTQAQELQKTHQENSAGVQQKHDAALQSLLLKYKEDLESSKVSDDIKIKDLIEKHEAALRTAREGHSLAIEAAEQRQRKAEHSHLEELERSKAHVAKLEQDQKALGKVHEGQIRDLKAAHSETLSAVQARYAEKLGGLERDHQTKIDLETDNWQRQASDADLVHQDELAKLKASHESRYAALEADLAKGQREAVETAAEHQRVVNELQSNHTSNDEQKLSEHNKELAVARDLTAQASAELTAERTRHIEAIEALKEEHDTAIAAQASSHDDLLKDLHNQHRAELISVRGTVAQLQAEKISSAGDHNEVLRRLRTEHEAAIERTTLEHAKVHERLAAEHEQEIRTLQKKHDDDIISIRREVENSTSAVHEGVTTKLRTEHADEVTRLLAQHNAELQSAKQSAEDLRSRLADEISQHENVVAKNADETAALRSEHDATITKLKTEHEAQLSSLREVGNKSDHERERDHEADLANARGLARAEADSLRNEHSIALAAAEFAQRESVYQIQASHDQQIKILAEQHQKRLDDLRVTMTQRQAKREDDFEASKKAAAEELDRVRREHAKALEAARSEGGSMLEARLAEAAAKTDVLTSQHDQALSNAQHELDGLRREHEEALASVKRTLEGELDVTRSMHKKSIDELQATLQSQLEEAKMSHSRVVAEHDGAWVAKLHALKEEHAKSLAELMSNSDTTTAAKLKELDQLHADATAMAAENACKEANERAAIAESQHKLALEAAVQKARSSSHAEVRNLKKRHQDAMSHIRETLQKSSAAQLSELELTHRNDIEHALERAKHAAEAERKELVATHQAALDEDRSRAMQAHQVEVMRLTTEHQAKLANLEARLQMDNATQDTSRQAAHDAEIEALQARLDATMTGQAEAERALASLRKQVVNADKRISEAKAESEDQITALVHEKDDLTSQLVQVQASLRELQRKTTSGSGTPRASSIAIREEVTGLQTQITMLEEERSTMRLLLHKRQDEKNEISRQNDFLVKELEMLLQQRSRSRDVSRSSTDAIVQTEPALVEPKADVATFAPIKAAYRNANGSRPITPLSPGLRQAREDVEMAWKSRSFEDYLDNARAELSELGSVISANEALFARKINEHVGELQRAKDELAADYTAKVDALAKDKDTMEKLITSEQHAQFVKDRKKLVAKFGASSDEVAERSAMLTSLPADTAVALRTAEQKLVDDYNQRITKRKSQIALKHAEEFQTITQDYDRSVKVLLNTRSRLEGDLSVDPSKFEDEYVDIADRSAQLVAERKSNIGAPRSARRKSISPHDIPRRVDSLPDHNVPPMPIAPPEALEVDRTRPRLRSRTSNPRNERSIPRSTSRPREFFPGSRDSPEATSQPLKARPGSSSKHPPVPQHSLMRTKEAADFFAAPTRVVTDPLPDTHAPRTPRGRPKSRATDSGIFQTPPLEPEGFGSQQAAFADMRVVSLQAKSPSILRRIRDKISLDSSSRFGKEAPPSSSRTGGLSRPGGSSRPGSSLGKPHSSSEPTPEKAPAAAWRPSHPRRSKSRHLSSGMIYYKDPANKPPMPGPYNP